MHVLHTATSVNVSDVTDHVTKASSVAFTCRKKNVVIQPLANNNFFLVSKLIKIIEHE